MPSRISIRDGVITRQDRVDHAEADRGRRVFRDMARRPGRSSPIGHVFAWSEEEDRLLRKIRPELFEGSARDRQKALKRFAQTSEGKAFLCR